MKSCSPLTVWCVRLHTSVAPLGDVLRLSKDLSSGDGIGNSARRDSAWRSSRLSNSSQWTGTRY